MFKKKDWWLFALPLLAAIALGLFLRVPEKRVEAEMTTRAADVWNVAVTTSSNVLSTSLSPLTRGSAVSTPGVGTVTYRFIVGIAPTATASVMDLRVTNVATSMEVNFALNSGQALTPGAIYSFEFNASAAFTYNFRPETNTTLGILSVDRKEDVQ